MSYPEQPDWDRDPWPGDPPDDVIAEARAERLQRGRSLRWCPVCHHYGCTPRCPEWDGPEPEAA